MVVTYDAIGKNVMKGTRVVKVCKTPEEAKEYAQKMTDEAYAKDRTIKREDARKRRASK